MSRASKGKGGWHADGFIGGDTALPRTHTDYGLDGNPVLVYNANDSVVAAGTFGGNAAKTRWR